MNIRGDVLDAMDPIQARGEKILVIGHCRLHEPLKCLLTLQDCYLNQCPITAIGLSLVGAIPNLLFGIKKPEAVILAIPGNAVRLVDDLLIILQI